MELFASNQFDCYQSLSKSQTNSNPIGEKIAGVFANLKLDAIIQGVKTPPDSESESDSGDIEREQNYDEIYEDDLIDDGLIKIDNEEVEEEIP